VELLVEQQQLQGLKDAKEQQARPGGLLEQHSVGGSLSGLAAGPPSKSSLKAAGDVAAPPGSPSAAGPGSSNCTGQHLAEANRELLRQEVAAMLRALSGQHPWVLGLPEAQQQQTALQDKGARKASAAVLTTGQVLEVTGMQHVRQAADERLGPQPSSNIPGGGCGIGWPLLVNLFLFCARSCCARSCCTRFCWLQARTRQESAPTQSHDHELIPDPALSLLCLRLPWLWPCPALSLQVSRTCMLSWRHMVRR
jgi:hypothetical protein